MSKKVSDESIIISVKPTSSSCSYKTFLSSNVTKYTWRYNNITM